MCAGAGGQALGLEAAGFEHWACVEWEPAACDTLRANRPQWNVIEGDLRKWKPEPGMVGVDLLAGGVPCPPFSIAGNQLGREDERDLFPEIVRLAQELKPRALMIENVRGLLGKKFDAYRTEIVSNLKKLGYEFCGWELFNAADFGVPQARLRSILVAMRPDAAQFFEWAKPNTKHVTVGDALLPFMRASGWDGAEAWAKGAQGLAPALVGGSKKHGGADLGPTRAKARWAELGIDGKGVATNTPMERGKGMPRLTVSMAAAIQGFPAHWKFQGLKTAAYRQVGNAFPPPVAEAVGKSIRRALLTADTMETGR
ncbi:DNA cytosine methyltransferase [Stackebrandtia soli]|uniref:DNA cytosine methyltransferase n=1 Tax=Stackebrandtia soli TaxID=1892856 RepID=UPI0039E95D95